MKTLQTQYNLIKEGKGSKHIFLKEAKSLYPDMITNFSTFEQTEKILKNRGVINENVVGLRPINDWEPSPKQDYEIAFKNFLSEMEEEKVKADTKKVSKYVEDTDAHNFDNKNRKNIDNLSGQEVLNGFYTELKAPKNADKTKDQLMDIVTKNLSKDPLYYIKNGQFGTEGVGYTEDAPGLGKPKEAKGKYKSSGYGDLDNKQTAPKPNVKDSGKSEYKTGMPKKVKEMDMKAQSSKGVQKMTTPGKPKTVKLNENQESNEDISTRSVGSMVKPKGFQVGDKVKYKGMNHEITRMVDDRIYIKNLRYGGRPDTWVKAIDLKEGIHDRNILSRPSSNPDITPLERSPEELNKETDGRSENILRMRYNMQINDPAISDEELRYILSGKGVKGFGGTKNAVDKIINSRKLEENQESNEDVLKDLISRHDQYFRMSDDNRSYVNGIASEKKIMDLFKNLISKHDWYFRMSDDNRSYVNGIASEKKIMDLIKLMGEKGMEDKAKEIYNSMAPKEEQLKESVVDKIVESILRRLKKIK